MRYSLILVPFCTLSVLAQPVAKLGESTDATTQVVELENTVPAGTSLALSELLANTSPEEPVEKRDTELAQGKGPKNKFKAKWKSPEGNDCKVKCKYGRCNTSGGSSCEESGPWDDYPSEHKMKVKWPGPNGEQCKEKCHHGKCEIEGGEACKNHDFSKLVQNASKYGQGH